jgi:putative NADH-flavin reductase
MKILILGITGRTGSLAAEEAIKRGHKVVGIARDKSRVKVAGAEIVEGTPYDYETVKKAIDGCDSVISMLNIFPASQALFGKIKSPLDSMSVSIRNCVKLMNEKGIKRIVVMTANGVGDSFSDLPGFFKFMLKVTNIKYAYADHAVQEKVLEDSSLDWTVVRPVGLTDKNGNLTILNSLSEGVKINSMVSRNAVAHFMLDCIEKGQFIKQKPAVSNS